MRQPRAEREDHEETVERDSLKVPYPAVNSLAF
jgi:hypothetical protein